MLDKKLQAIYIPFLTGLTGVIVGASMVSRFEDNITAKTLRIVDEDGNERVLADSSGISVRGEEKSDAVQIKSGGKAQIIFIRDGETFISIGELKDAASGIGSIDGFVAYDSGAPRISLTATKRGGFLVLDTVETARSIEELFDRKEHPSTFVSLTALGDGPVVSIGDSSGKSKDFGLDNEFIRP